MRTILLPIALLALAAGCKPVNEASTSVEATPPAPASSAADAIPATSAPAAAANGELTAAVAMAHTDAIELGLGSDAKEPLLVASGQAVSLTFAAPRSGTIAGFGVQIGNFGDTADGQLDGTLCAGSACAKGSAPIQGSMDSGTLSIALDHGVKVAQGQILTATATRASGDQSFAVWTYPGDGKTSEMVLPDGTSAPRRLRIALNYAR